MTPHTLHFLEREKGFLFVLVCSRAVETELELEPGAEAEGTLGSGAGAIARASMIAPALVPALY